MNRLFASSILLGKEDRRIECSFLEVSTSSKPRYSSLSYIRSNAAITDGLVGCYVVVVDPTRA
jgi:hypothetical protein